MLVRRWRGMVVGAALVTGASCAAETDPITFDSVAPETVAPSTLAPVMSIVDTTEPAPTEPPPGSFMVGEEWTDATGNLAGLASECDNLTLVTTRDATGELIAAVALQGVFASDDGGATWTRLAPQPGGTTNRARTVLFDPDDPERVWLSGPGVGEGVYRSDDGGATFALLGEGFGAGRASVDFGDPERRTLLAVVEGRPTVMRSEDGGASWSDVSEELPYNFGEPRGTLVLDRETYLVGSRNGPLAGVFRTTDGGATWSRSYVGGIAGSPLVRADGSIAWLLEYGGGVIVSRDGGESWDSETGSGISWVSEHLVELPDGRLATFGESNVLISPDEGDSWQPVGPALPFRPNGITYDRSHGAFYIWQSQCGIEDSYPVLPESLLRLAFTLTGSSGADSTSPGGQSPGESTG